MLAVVNTLDGWHTAQDIAIRANLSHKQTIDVLYALHNTNLVARHGRTFTARWGSLSMLQVPEANFALLEQLFRGFVGKDSPHPARVYRACCQARGCQLGCHD